MKMLKRTLALMLALIMMFSAVPFNAYATESTDEPSVPTTAPVDAPETEEPVVEEPEVEEPEVEEPVEEEAVVMTSKTRAVSSGEFQRILHLDCGRKYFTVDWIKALITEMSAAGYTHLQLAFGNDGLRFLLDDMSVGSYSDEAVTAAVQAGNKAYNSKKSYSTSVNELTQADMDEIIAHANKSGIKIIPLLNNPGHMYTLITAMTNLGMTPGYNGSASTVDLQDTEAVNFVKGLLQKYVNYFSAKGCTVFNIGADEYANDNYSNGSMGFGHLLSSGKYQLFVNYVNSLNAMIKAAGMKTMAFNDGIYFQSKTSYAFDKDIMISFWTSGWGSYYSLSAKEMAAKGHPMVNTHGDYYFILKNEGTIQNPSSTALNFDNTKFMSSTVSDPAGSTFCIWCDNPGLATEQEVAAAVRITLRKMAASMNNTDSYSDAVVAGGFNADGTLNVVVTPDPEPEVPEDVGQPDAATGIVVTAPGLTGLTVKEATAPAVEGAAEGKVLAWDMTPATADGNYEGEATVAVPVPEGWDGNKMGAFVITDGAVELLSGELNEAGLFQFTMPHFSVGGVYEVAAAAEELKDTVAAGTGTATSYVLDTDGLDANAQYLIVYNGNALTNEKGSLAVTVNGNNATPSGDTSSALWTYTKESGWYSTSYYLSNGNNYLYTTRSGSYGNRTYTLNIKSIKTAVVIYNNKIYNTDYNSQVTYGSPTWGASDSGSTLSFYKYTEGTQTYTVDAALQESRINAVANIPNEGYTDDSWNAYQAALTAAQAKLAEIKGKSYTVKSDAEAALSDLIALVDALETAKAALEKAVQITIKYVLADGTEIKSEPVNVSDKATSIALSNFNANDKFYTVESATLAITPATKTEYTVKVTEAEEDLTAVDPLEIEYWITNQYVTDPDTNLRTLSIPATTPGIYSEAGVPFTALAPEFISAGDRNREYWQVRLLDVLKANNTTNGTEYQTRGPGDDETTNGSEVTHVRYWNGAWQVLSGAQWITVNLNTVTATDMDSEQKTTSVTRAQNQLVAYYMEILDIKNQNGTTELHINAADWGKKGDNTPNTEWMDVNNYCSVSIQIVYESGSTNPATDTAADLKSKTIVYGYWPDGRGIGTLKFDGMDEFDIYKVTAETGAVTASIPSSSSPVNVTRLTWDDNEKTVWEGDPTQTVAIANNAKNPSTTDPYDNLMWSENKEAILIRVYVKTIIKEDSLNVVYYDEKFGDTLYSYGVNVNDGVNFNNGITPTPGAFTGNADRIDVTGSHITNNKGIDVAFQTDLTKVPEAVGKYHSELYTYTGSEISEDGKTLYLYYNINTDVLKPNFVVDFGLPITFNLSDIVENVGAVDSVGKLSARYGTVSYNPSTKTFTYTPTKVLQNVDVLSITLTMAGTTSTTNVGVTPATTVYYGEKFINFGSGWTTEGTPSPAGNQATELLGSSSYYGYDNAYKKLGASDGTSKKATAIGSSATFEFTGTGIQVFANATESSGYASVTVKDKATGKTMKMAMVDTVVNGTEGTETTGGQSGNLAGLPIVSLVDLANIPYATYTVTISKVMDTDPIYIDGIRVFDSINAATKDENNIYFADKEDCPDFYELRDVVLKALNIQISDSADYETMYQQLYDASVGAHASAIVTTSGNIDYTATDDAAARQDLLDNGPKNELYLFPGDTLTFNVNSTARIMQLGMKAPNTAVDAEVTIGNTTTKYDIDSSVDMFYKIQDAAQTATNYTVQVKNASDSGILSVTLLKICDDPSFAFAPLTEDNIKAILADAGYTEETPDVPETPVEPEVPEETTKPTEPEVEETTKPSKPNKPSKPEKPGKPENTKPTEPEVEETTKPSKPSKPGKPENTKPTEPQKPGKPGNNGNQKPGKEEKTYTLKITFVNLFGKKVGTATITTTSGVVSAYEIIKAAPKGRTAIWLIPVTLKANGNTSIVVPVL